jgi:hypothetical protein
VLSTTPGARAAARCGTNGRALLAADQRPIAAPPAAGIAIFAASSPFVAGASRETRLVWTRTRPAAGVVNAWNRNAT